GGAFPAPPPRSMSLGSVVRVEGVIGSATRFPPRSRGGGDRTRTGLAPARGSRKLERPDHGQIWVDKRLPPATGGPGGSAGCRGRERGRRFGAPASRSSARARRVARCGGRARRPVPHGGEPLARRAALAGTRRRARRASVLRVERVPHHGAPARRA